MGIIRQCKRNSGLCCKKAKKKIKGFNPVLDHGVGTKKKMWGALQMKITGEHAHKRSYLRCCGCIHMHKMLLLYSCNSAGIKWMTMLRKAAWRRRRMKGAAQVFLQGGGNFLWAMWSVSFVIVWFCMHWIGDQHDSMCASKLAYTSPISIIFSNLFRAFSVCSVLGTPEFGQND